VVSVGISRTGEFGTSTTGLSVLSDRFDVVAGVLGGGLYSGE
jgi:hypothetical protein